MRKRLALVTVAGLTMITGDERAQQYPILDIVATKVVQRYQQMSCQQAVSATSCAEVAKRTRDGSESAERSADGASVILESCNSDCEQDV